jgi:DNA repair exonuclease SbcCD ATPase subunit
MGETEAGSSKETQKDKQKEREVYPAGNGTGTLRNKSQELLDAFKPSSKSSRSSKSQAIKTLTAENQSLTSQVQALEEQLQSASEREHIAQSRVQALEEQTRRLEQKSTQDEEEIQTLLKTSTRSTEAAARHMRELEQHSQTLEEQVKRLRERAQRAETAAAHAQSQAASTSRSTPPSRRGTGSSVPEVHHASAERRAEEVFQSKADMYAGAEIIRMVQALNAEILQCAAFIAESVMGTDVRVHEDARTVEKCRKRAVERVGQRLVVAMRRTIDIGERDPLPLQLALQHSIIVWACFIVQSFTPDNRELNGHLSGIWGKVSMRGTFHVVTLGHGTMR